MVILVTTALIAVSCSSSESGSRASGTLSEPASSSTTAVDDYPDAIVRELRRLASEPRPVPNSALPPRHLDVEGFPESLVDRYLIVSGGPPHDGIPSIDEPEFWAAADVDWLKDREPVLTLTIGDDTRAYPLQIMLWHEIVNDVVEGVPVAVTYCPLCNSGLAFERVHDGRLLDFGTSGALYQSALVMYDRQTESLWTHFDGRAVVGDLIGGELVPLPVATVSWSDFRLAHPDGRVLGPADAARPYGRNPYGSYESIDEPLPGFFTGDVDDRLPPKERVVGIRPGAERLAVALERLEREGVLHLEIFGQPIVVWLVPGTASALDGSTVGDGGDVGATGVFATDRRFERVDGQLIDIGSGSTWNVLGQATGGPLAGRTLEPVTHVDTFWFAWVTYHPDTELVD